ncbi:MAG: hypothetical protein JSU95_07010 [Betaproteobacteria bacterium]|nr:MAG: hypothetical protein JSU95_07010 [Betaproteobacteria bacterium]
MFDTLGRLTAISVIVALLSACASVNVQRAEPEIERDPGEKPTIVVMPLDVELGELTAGGVVEPHSAWTEAALKNMRAALDDQAEVYNVTLVDYQPQLGTAEERATSIELIKLHRAVGGSVLLHHYLPDYALPSKERQLDWSLGPAVEAISRTHDADYALFIFVRDNYTTAGRMAVMLVGGLLGAYIPGGSQVGFASVVDLSSGDIVWFNRLVRTTGDLRSPENAAETVRTLVSDAMK